MGEKTVHTYCRICLAGCGLDVTVDPQRNEVLSIEPDRANPYTWRDFCRKGKTAHEVVMHPQRLTTPMKRVGDHYEPATYEEAIADIAARLNAIIDRHGPDAVGSYHGNPMGFTFSVTSYWTGLLDAIGTGNRFWVGSIDQNNSHVVAEQMYGFELVALPPDIDECDHFLLIGMDPAVSKFNWMDNNPDGWNRVLARQREGAEVIVVDPRRSSTASKAGTHVAILPGTDWAFLLGVIKVIFDEGLERLSTVVGLNGVDALRSLAASAELSDLAARCGVSDAEIADVARRFARARTAMCLTHTGVSHNEHGTLGEWLAHALNLITDRTDRPGGRRFERGFVDMAKIMSLFAPGGPNRKAGAAGASAAAASKHRTRLRDTPTVVAFHSLSELPDEITTPGPGQIKAVLMAFGNPVISGPDGRAMDEALEQLDLLVAVDLVQRESHRHAHWLIPGTHWLEREELHPLFANLQEQPYVQYANRAVEKPSGVMDEWEFFTELALAMNRNMFGKPGVNTFIRASRKVAARFGKPGLAMNPEWIGRLMVAMGRRLKWKDIVAHEHGWVFGEKTYGHLPETVLTDDKRVQVAPPVFVAEAARLVATPPVQEPAFPMLMSNKRVRESMNSWLNESPGLFKRGRENRIEINPDDARELEIEEGARVRVSSPLGSVELVAEVTDAMRRGVVCVPHGWGGRVFDPVSGDTLDAPGVNRNLLVDSRRIDRFSQTPALNSTMVRVEPVAVADTPDAQSAETAVVG